MSLEEEPPSSAQAELVPRPKALAQPFPHLNGHGASAAGSARASGRAPALRHQLGQQRVPQASLPRRQSRRVERLALAKPQPRPHARAARADDRRHGRRARRDHPARGSAAGRRHAVLHEPARPANADAGAAPDRRSRRSRSSTRTPGEADDPLGEDGHSPVPGLVHRYPDRVLLLVTDFCSTYCRYCTRLARRRRDAASARCARADMSAAFDYIAAHAADPRRA